MRKKNIMKSVNLKKMYTVQEKMRSQIKTQLKVKKEDGREAPLRPSIYIL